jgi:plasmid stabilization system protein ParE
MSVRKTGTFIADVERQYEWYAVEAGWEVAERFLVAVRATCDLLGLYPFLGSNIRSNHPRLKGWRSFVVLRPFNRHILFYEVTGGEVLLRRAIHGNRDIPRHLAEPPVTAP